MLIFAFSPFLSVTFNPFLPESPSVLSPVVLFISHTFHLAVIPSLQQEKILKNISLATYCIIPQITVRMVLLTTGRL
jgi:hypothetical protein